MMRVKIKKLDNRITLPEYATEGSAGLDLRGVLTMKLLSPQARQRWWAQE